MYTHARTGHAAYRQGQVAAADPLRIVILLYEGAISSARQALASFDDPAQRGQALGRAHRIVAELLTSLDAERGGEIATNLTRLYQYVLDEITRGTVERRRDSVESVIEVLETLLSGWRGIEEQQSLATPETGAAPR